MSLGLILGPRLLRAAGHHSEPMFTNTGVVAGSSHGNHFARIVLHEILQAAHTSPPQRDISAFVDDVRQRGESEHRRNDQWVPDFCLDVLALGDRFTAVGFEISSKTVLVASSPAIGQRIARVLLSRAAAWHLPSDWKPQQARAKDLGVEAAAGRRRCARLLAARRGKAQARSKRAAWLHKASKKGAQLYRAGAQPQAQYGTQCWGIAPRPLAKLRAAAVRAAGFDRKGQCMTTAASIAFGPADPSIALRVDQIIEWVRLWVREPQLRERMCRAWAVALARLTHRDQETFEQQRQRRWHRVRGVTCATIANLLDIGWKPLGAARWKDIRGNAWIMTEACDTKELAGDLRADAAGRLWRKSAREAWGGQGLLEGPDLSVYRRHHKHLLSKNLLVEAGMLDASVTGATWTQQRLHREGRRNCEVSVLRLSRGEHAAQIVELPCYSSRGGRVAMVRPGLCTFAALA